jgi:hypothetical protein
MPPQSGSCYRKSLPLSGSFPIGQGGGRWLSERHPPEIIQGRASGLDIDSGQGLPTRPFGPPRRARGRHPRVNPQTFGLASVHFLKTAEPSGSRRLFLPTQLVEWRREAVMNRARVKKPPTHYLVVGSAVAGEGFLDSDGSTIVLRLAKGTSLSWRDRKKLRLLPIHPIATPSRLPAQSTA